MKRTLLIIIAAALASAAPLTHSDIRGLERRFDQAIQRFNIDDPLDLIGSTRGLYIENYGVVFTSEVSLVTVPLETPFRPRPQAEDVERLRVKKVSRLPEIRKIMRNMLITSATTLKAVPVREQVVVGVSFFHQPWEQKTDLPGQIVMKATRQALIDIEAGRANDSAIEERSY